MRGNAGNLHPINHLLLKKLLLPGFDDGVLTLECQIGNPIPASLANMPPFNSYFNPYERYQAPGIFYHTNKVKLVDMANRPYRATSFYITQTKEEHSVLGAAAASSTPFISTTGMVRHLIHQTHSFEIHYYVIQSLFFSSINLLS